MEPAYFADAAFWIALSSRRDQFHSRAREWHPHLRRSRLPLITTEAVLWEWVNALADPTTRVTAVEACRRCHRDPRIEVVAFDLGLIEAAVQLFESRQDKNWSLTDCSSFVVMESRKLTDALTVDRHFQQAGFRVVLLEAPPRP